MERKLIDYLPDTLRGYREFAAIADGQQWLYDGLWEAVDRALDDQFVPSAGEYGLSRWESILGIYAKGTDTEEERRTRILLRLSEQLPFTMRRLAAQLRSVSGVDCAVELRMGGCVLRVRLPLTARTNEADVRSLLARVVPLNLAIDFDLARNQHRQLAAYTHRELAAFTHRELNERVMNDAESVGAL